MAVAADRIVAIGHIVASQAVEPPVETRWAGAWRADRTASAAADHTAASAAEAVHKVAVVRIAAAGRMAWVAAVRIEARPAVADCSLAPAAAEAGYTAVAHSAVDHTEECSPCEKSFLSFFLFLNVESVNTEGNIDVSVSFDELQHNILRRNMRASYCRMSIVRRHGRHLPTMGI